MSVSHVPYSLLVMRATWNIVIVSNCPALKMIRDNDSHRDWPHAHLSCWQSERPAAGVRPRFTFVSEGRRLNHAGDGRATGAVPRAVLGRVARGEASRAADGGTSWSTPADVVASVSSVKRGSICGRLPRETERPYGSLVWSSIGDGVASSQWRN